MSKPIIAGVDGIDAQNAIISVIDNDELNDLIVQASQSQGQDADVRPVIDDWFQDNFPEYVSMMQQAVTSPVPNQENNNPRTVQPQRESLDALKRLAGLL
jgi:hypothetical protein